MTFNYLEMNIKMHQIINSCVREVPCCEYSRSTIEIEFISVGRGLKIDSEFERI